MDEVNKTKLSYNITPITDNYVPAIISLLKNSFFLDEPLNKSIGLTEEIRSVIQLEEYCKTYLLTGISFMAVSDNNEIIGVILNNIMCRDDITENEVEVFDESLQFNKILIILDKVQREANVFGQYPNANRIMDLKIITVDKAYRGQGICKALVNKTRELALELECQIIYVECSSHFTAKTAEKLGFKCIYSLSYLDYVNEQGEVIFNTQSPHRHFKVYALQL
ncbi:dopamine N-acetyltransferase-like [Sipha flava]|uniref:aralkylamine N-acetyltransferase n=1 Tax=Sipha flava TaxID=143950 RepID=A0A8B8G7Z2_9HEMI|nr:dopamine N-acetyltransferase-like [Sipha flava]